MLHVLFDKETHRRATCAELTPSSAEVSVSVAERWQGKGLAKLMLSKLECCAAAGGVRWITCETLATNERALSLARKAGYMISESARGVMRLEKRLALSDHKCPSAVFEVDSASAG